MLYNNVFQCLYFILIAQFRVDFKNLGNPEAELSSIVLLTEWQQRNLSFKNSLNKLQVSYFPRERPEYWFGLDNHNFSYWLSFESVPPISPFSEGYHQSYQNEASSHDAGRRITLIIVLQYFDNTFHRLLFICPVLRLRWFILKNICQGKTI